MNGAAGNANAVSAFQTSPGYQFAVDQALEGINRSAAARGGMLGGNTLAALSDRAGNMANQEYGSWLDRLQGYVNPELTATGAQAGYTAAKVPVITGAANSLVGLDQNTTKGINDQTTQAANAEMAGSGNLWNFGLNLGKLALGGVGGFGGSSLLGGSGGSGAALGSMNVGGQLFPKYG